MLLITRRTGESIVINDTITLKVLDVRGNRVKLGFEYPEGNTVYREELFTKILTENRSAAQAVSNAKLSDALRALGGKAGSVPHVSNPTAAEQPTASAAQHKEATAHETPTPNRKRTDGGPDDR